MELDTHLPRATLAGGGKVSFVFVEQLLGGELGWRSENTDRSRPCRGEVDDSAEKVTQSRRTDSARHVQRRRHGSTWDISRWRHGPSWHVSLNTHSTWAGLPAQVIEDQEGYMLDWLARVLDGIPAGNLGGSGGRQMAQKIYYRTRDGRADYGFSIEELSDGTYRAYITSQPSYGSRSSGAHETHRLSDGGRQYVCWTRSLDSAEDARQVAALWADATQAYIRTGQRF